MSLVAEITRNSAAQPTVLIDNILIADCDVDFLARGSVIEKIQALADSYELVFRIYGTPMGLRVICVSDFIRPVAPIAIRLLKELGSDPRYNDAVVKIGKFSARLGGKARRMGIPLPEKFHYYDLLPKEQRAWDAIYDAAAVNYRACEFLLQTSECEMSSQIANFIALHDERTKCFSDLPMA